MIRYYFLAVQIGQSIFNKKKHFIFNKIILLSCHERKSNYYAVELLQERMTKKQNNLDFIGTLFKSQLVVLASSDDLWAVFGEHLARYAMSSFNFGRIPLARSGVVGHAY